MIKFKLFIASTVSTVAMLIAHSSANACALWWLEEPKIPESLVVRD